MSRFKKLLVFLRDSVPLSLGIHLGFGILVARRRKPQKNQGRQRPRGPVNPLNLEL